MSKVKTVREGVVLYAHPLRGNRKLVEDLVAYLEKAWSTRAYVGRRVGRRGELRRRAAARRQGAAGHV